MGKVTIKDIAKELNISIATVSRVLNNSGYASEEIRKKVLETAKRLNYQPNAIARSLKVEKTNTIGVIIPDISNPYFMTIAKGIEDTVQEKNYDLIFMSGNQDPKKEKKLLKILVEKRVDALVLATSGENEQLIKSIKASGVPIVLVDRKLNDDSLGLNLVAEDNIKGAYELTSYLIQQGHTKIGVINGSLKVSTGVERYKGYKKAMKEHGIPLNSNFIFNGNFTKKDGSRAIDYFLELKDKPTAFLSFNNTMSFGAIVQLIKKGYKVPDDFLFASYGELEGAELLKNLKIVSIKQLPYKMGKKVGEILLKRLSRNVDNSPIEVLFNVSLNED